MSILSAIKLYSYSCRDWREVLLSDSSKFWGWAVLDVDPVKYPSQAEALLDSRILYAVPEIKISHATSPIILEESLLQVVGQGKTPRLKKMTLDLYQDLYHIDPTLVSRAALTVQEFVIIGGLSAQLQAILTGIQDCTNAGLKSLTVESDSLDLVSWDVLAGAAVKLERLEVRSKLSSVHVEAILVRVAATQDSRLRRFWYGSLLSDLSDLSGLDPEVVAQALVKLETVGYPSLWVDSQLTRSSLSSPGSERPPT